MSGEYWDDLPPVPDEVTIPRSQYEALMAANEALRASHMVLAALIKPNPNESALHIFAHAVEAETKVLAALRAAGILEET